jgi:hypothetical protein
MAELPLAIRMSLDEVMTATVTIETYLPSWDWNGMLADSEKRLAGIKPGTPVDSLRNADQRFDRLFHAVERYTSLLNNAMLEMEKQKAEPELKQKAYAELYETLERIANVVEGARGRYPQFFALFDHATSLEEKLRSVGERIWTRTTPEFIAAARDSKRTVDWMWYAKRAWLYAEAEPKKADVFAMTRQPEIFKITPMRTEPSAAEMRQERKEEEPLQPPKYPVLRPLKRG